MDGDVSAKLKIEVGIDPEEESKYILGKGESTIGYIEKCSC